MPSLDVQEVCSFSPLFRGLADTELDGIVKAADLRKERRRTMLFRQGDLPNRLFILAKGVVKISQTNGSGESVTLRLITPGEILACVAVFRQLPYPATATTATESILLSWPASMILDLMKENPILKVNALDIVGRRTEELTRQFTRMATERVDQRIARALLGLAEQTGHMVPGGIEIGFSLSRQDIAEIAGTDLFSVSRLLRKWAGQGLIIARRLRVTVLDLPALEAVAGKSH